jgi:hypothetical protein
MSFSALTGATIACLSPGMTITATVPGGAAVPPDLIDANADATSCATG